MMEPLRFEGLLAATGIDLQSSVDMLVVQVIGELCRYDIEATSQEIYGFARTQPQRLVGLLENMSRALQVGNAIWAYTFLEWRRDAIEKIEQAIGREGLTTGTNWEDPEIPPKRLQEVYDLPYSAASKLGMVDITEHLSGILGFSFKDIQRAIAGNPNTPTEVLVKAAHPFPESVLQNPAFAFLLLGDPTLKQFQDGHLASLYVAAKHLEMTREEKILQRIQEERVKESLTRIIDSPRYIPHYIYLPGSLTPIKNVRS
jgi:hypothetical protein